MEKEVGKVTHWYDKIQVAVVRLTDTLKKGDRVKIKRGDNEFEDVISSIQIDHQDVDSAGKGKEAAIKLSAGRTKEGSIVYKVE